MRAVIIILWIFNVLFWGSIILTIYLMIIENSCDYESSLVKVIQESRISDGNYEITSSDKTDAFFKSLGCYLFMAFVGAMAATGVWVAPFTIFFMGIVLPLVPFSLLAFVEKKLLWFPIGAVCSIAFYFYFTKLTIPYGSDIINLSVKAVEWFFSNSYKVFL